MKPLVRVAMRTYGTLLPSRAARSLEGLLLRPWPVEDIEAPETGSPARVSRLPYAHGWLHVTEYGEGPPVLLIHGWGGRGRSMRPFVDPLVARGLRVVSIDLPAHGSSSGRQTNLIECAGAVLQVERHIGRPVAVLTHSFGGAVLALAWSHGFEAGRVVMLAPPANLYALMLPAAGAIGIPRSVGERCLADFAERLGFEWDDLRVDTLVRSVEAPLLVVHDEGDRVTPWADGRGVAEAAPRGSLVTTRGLGHRRVLMDPDVRRQVTAFAVPRPA